MKRNLRKVSEKVVSAVLGDRFIYFKIGREKFQKKVALTKQWFLAMGSFTSKYEQKGCRKSGLSRGVVLGDRFVFINMKRKVSEEEAKWWFVMTVSLTSKYGEKGFRKSDFSRVVVLPSGRSFISGFIQINIGIVHHTCITYTYTYTPTQSKKKTCTHIPAQHGSFTLSTKPFPCTQAAYPLGSKRNTHKISTGWMLQSSYRTALRL